MMAFWREQQQIAGTMMQRAYQKYSISIEVSKTNKPTDRYSDLLRCVKHAKTILTIRESLDRQWHVGNFST